MLRPADIRILRSVSWLTACASLLLGSHTIAEAQATGFGVEGRAGIGLPAGELAEFVDVGPGFGMKLLYSVSERVSLTADGSVILFGGAGGGGSVQAWSYLGGLRLKLVGESGATWFLVGHGAVGATSFSRGEEIRFLEPFPRFPPSRASLLSTSAAVQAGLGVERSLGDRLSLFLDAGVHLMFTEAEDVTVDGRTREGFGTTSAVPIMAGLQFRP